MKSKFLLAGLLLAAATAWAAPAPSDLQARRDALDKLLAEQWEYTLSHAPEFASARSEVPATSNGQGREE